MPTSRVQLEIGIQSTNPDTLKAVNRAENVYPVLYNTGRLVECGTCHTHVDLIAGLPYETMDTFERGFDKVYASNKAMKRLLLTFEILCEQKTAIDEDTSTARQDLLAALIKDQFNYTNI